MEGATIASLQKEFVCKKSRAAESECQTPMPCMMIRSEEYHSAIIPCSLLRERDLERGILDSVHHAGTRLCVIKEEDLTRPLDFDYGFFYTHDIPRASPGHVPRRRSEVRRLCSLCWTPKSGPPERSPNQPPRSRTHCRGPNNYYVTLPHSYYRAAIPYTQNIKTYLK